MEGGEGLDDDRIGDILKDCGDGPLDMSNVFPSGCKEDITYRRVRKATQCCCLGDKYVYLMLHCSYNDMKYLLRCNRGNFQYGSVLMTITMAFINKII